MPSETCWLNNFNFVVVIWIVDIWKMIYNNITDRFYKRITYNYLRHFGILLECEFISFFIYHDGVWNEINLYEIVRFCFSHFTSRACETRNV